MTEVIRETIQKNAERPTNVTSMACGPAQELFDAEDTVTHDQKVCANLIDFDLQALAFVSDRIEQTSQKMTYRIFHENLIHLATGRRSIKIVPQNLVYSIGLIDYFKDDMVVRLLSLAYSLLANGGKLVIGNFHTSNPIREFLDHVLEWNLIHRSEEDMNRLFRESAFGRPADEFKFEGEGINMFAIIEK